MNRRQLGELALRITGASVLLPSISPSPAAAATRGDGKWAEHVGMFQEKDITDGFQVTEVSLKCVSFGCMLPWIMT